ncbi:disease resistance protein RUN1-like [Telopea speciosissima]|uniref:disease resistance protein RUN1-like n=1 Tax=Telopea speciosissima TaxID=54955 RepID=UPI001CC70AF7|nr:disease resistance protein RUN1-like [Telopea speciosissima]
MVSRVGSSNYDVFINFRGKDTRNSFVGHLYSALKGRGIHAFIDSKDMWKGEDIGELLQIIKISKLSIAVFSETYVESDWCLRELAQMLECHRTNGQIIFPIFFKVKTAEVKNQNGCFEILPHIHGKEAPETLQRWKDALQAVGDKNGWVFNNGDQSELVKSIVQSVWLRLNVVPLVDAKYQVGLESRVESVLSLLSNASSTDVQFLGICGLSGIGKTTIAVAIYNHIFRNFSKSCFLENVREEAAKSNGIVYLQKILLEKIFGVEIKISNSREGSSSIKERLGKTDTLLILDDVDNHTQLEALAGDLSWFGPGSWIIITSRDQSILREIPQNNRKIYKPEELNEKESLQLFSSYAFSVDQPPDDFMQLSIDIVHTTGGLPLALEILGSDLSLNKEDKDVWKSMHRILKQIPHNDVYRKLRISYDNLGDDIEKAMFLDAACFFIGWKIETVISIWEACEFEPRYHIEVLNRKFLLQINEAKKLGMHDQIQNMGRGIVYSQSHMERDKYSRLWSRNDIMKVLKGGKGNEMVEGLFLRFSSNDNTCLYTECFEKMPKLRLLQVDGVTLKGSFQRLPSRLRWLSWQNYPLKELPVHFYHEELVILDLSYGLFRRAWNNWLENKLFQQLKVLRLSCCRSLSMSPNFSGFPRLEQLYLNKCDSLVNLHESIGQLQELIYLDLESCCSLKTLPNSICKLSSLQIIILNHCTSLEKLPESIGDLNESLVDLYLNKTNIKVLPDSVGLLKKLEVLDLSHRHALVNLPRSMENMTSLRHIELSVRNKLRCIPKLPSSLVQLRFHYQAYDFKPDLENVKRLLECSEDLAKVCFLRHKSHNIHLSQPPRRGTIKTGLFRRF